MKLVVDSSVAIKWFVRENFYDEADGLLSGRYQLFAPDFLVVEVANIAWKKAIRGEVTARQASIIVGACFENIPELNPAAELVERATDIALALKHPVYDCLYLACAEAVTATVVTADVRFCNVVLNTPFAVFVRELRSFPSN